jgi:hypothetical protein
MEGYRVPRRLARELSLPRRVGRIFRDEEELAASSDLSAGIRRALEASDILIVVCSPRTPGSRWVDAEVEHFRQLGRADHILAFLIEGEPAEAFPVSLGKIRRSEMAPAHPADMAGNPLEALAADVRPQRYIGRNAPRVRDASPRSRPCRSAIGCRKRSRRFIRLFSHVEDLRYFIRRDRRRYFLSAE